MALCFLYLPLALARDFLKVDFRFLILNLMPMGAVRWRMFLTYVLFFLIYYTANSIILNGTIAKRGRKEWVNGLLCVLYNIGGILLIRVLDQIVFTVTGFRPLTNYSTLGGNSSLAYVLSLTMIFLLAVNTLLSRFFYKKTGNVWVSGCICGMIATFCTVSNTVISSGIF